LKADPFAVCVAVSVVLGEEGLGFFGLAVGIVPSWRFWEEPDEEEDETGEHELEPDGDEPGDVTSHVDGSGTCSGCNDGTNRPVIDNNCF